MFSIYDGRKEFYQWDLDRKLIVEDSTIKQVHFCNKTDSCSLVVETYEENGLTLANVPNILLQSAWRINVYAYDGKATKHCATFGVIARTKPSDYVYTETEVVELETVIGVVKKGLSDNTVIINNKDNIAGLKGFYYTDVVFNENGGATFTLTDNQNGVVNNSLSIPYAVNDVVSIVNKNIYTNCAHIVLIDKNKIVLSDLPFTSIQKTENPANDEYTIYCLKKPTKGVVKLGQYATAEGENTQALERASHAEGKETKAYGQYSHAEGKGTEAHYCSHAEGNSTKATGNQSHAEGSGTTASAQASHAEGYNSNATGFASHAEGHTNEATNSGAHAEGNKTKATGANSHAEGMSTQAIATASHAEGNLCQATNSCAHAEGGETKATGNRSHAEGSATQAIGGSSHAEGSNTKAEGSSSHAEGNNTKAIGYYAHAEGYETKAEGGKAHAEGSYTHAKGEISHAEGYECSATGNYSHAQNYTTTASGSCSHAEGNGCIASGNRGHAEGYNTEARAENSHTEGSGTIAGSNNQHVQGKNNIIDKENKYAHIVGNGEYASEKHRSNAHTLDWSGNAWYAGYVECTHIILTSPNGSRYQLTVGDDGVLTTAAI